MKSLNIILFIMVCLLFATRTIAQEENNDQKRNRVEKKTKAFNMSYFSPTENSFYVLEANVVDKKIVLDSTATITAVPGKLPYPNGDFTVLVLDRNGKRITEYLMQDPLIARSCEGENNNVTALEKGRVFISLPKNNEIGSLVFSRGKERVGTLEIGDLIIKTQRDPKTGRQ